MKLFINHSRQFLLLLLAVVALGVVGCSTTDVANDSSRPWNAQQGWEYGLPGGMMEGR